MTSIDINSPELIERLRKKFKSQSGKNLTDKEILEKCLKFSMNHLDDWLKESESIENENGPNIDKNNDCKTSKIEDLFTGILEEEYELIKKSGKTVKEVIRGSWDFNDLINIKKSRKID